MSGNGHNGNGDHADRDYHDRQYDRQRRQFDPRGHGEIELSMGEVMGLSGGYDLKGQQQRGIERQRKERQQRLIAKWDAQDIEDAKRREEEAEQKRIEGRPRREPPGYTPGFGRSTEFGNGHGEARGEFPGSDPYFPRS